MKARRHDSDSKSTGLKSSKFRFCSNIKVYDTGSIAGLHRPAVLDVVICCNIRENGVISPAVIPCLARA